MSDDGHDSGEQRRREILAEARDMLERRLAEERALIFDAIKTLAQAIEQQREFVRELIGQECSKRDSHIAEVNAEFTRLWASLEAEHTALVAIQKERLAEARAKTERLLADVHADPAQKLH